VDSIDNLRERVEALEHHAHTTEDCMRRPAFVLTMVLALWTRFQTPGALAQTVITACQTLRASGSYVLANNLIAAGDCLVVDADFITIDLAGFTLFGNHTGTGISNLLERRGITVRNGTIFGFGSGISLLAEDSIVEGMRVSGNTDTGIFASGIVRNNLVQDNGSFGITSIGIVSGNTAIGSGSCCSGILATGTVIGNTARGNHGEGISASGTVTGNTAQVNEGNGIRAFNSEQGSTVSGNTASSNGGTGIDVACPANVIGNTAVANVGRNLRLNGAGCTNTNNLTP
jgi:hypothetical protein